MHVRAEMYTEQSASALGQYLEVALSLRVLQHAEAEALAGNREVLSIVRRDLQEYTTIRPALVKLSCRVQEAGSIT